MGNPMLLKSAIKLYRLKIKIITLTLAVTAIGLNCNSATVKNELCFFQKQLFNNANEFFLREQYLLSSTQYSLLFGPHCGNLSSKARFNYSLAMGNLGEIPEIVEQYRFFQREKNFFYRNKIQTLLDFRTTNIKNKKVFFWKNLNRKSSLSQLGIPKKILGKLQDEYIVKNNLKSPLFAGLASSLLPGLGQIYNGTYQSAAIAFMFNSLFFLTTLEFAKKKMKAPASASGIIFSVTYLGNIMNSVNGSRKINDKNALAIKKKIRKILFPELSLEQ